MKVNARSHCKESLQGVVSARGQCKESLQEAGPGRARHGKDIARLPQPAARGKANALRAEWKQGRAARPATCGASPPRLRGGRPEARRVPGGAPSDQLSRTPRGPTARLSHKQERPAAAGQAGEAPGTPPPCGAALPQWLRPSSSAARGCGRPPRRSGATSVASQHSASPKRVAP